MLLPLFFLLLMGVIEFALAFNALLNTNYASRNGGLMASQSGNILGADCLVLEAIEGSLHPPLDRARVRGVEIQRTNAAGNVQAANVYRRTGSHTCTYNDGSTKTVPYSRVSATYPEGQRCAVLPPQGCPTLVPPRTNVDTVGVQINYEYGMVTPLGSFMAMFNGSQPTQLDFVQRNVFRMEPKL